MASSVTGTIFIHGTLAYTFDRELLKGQCLNVEQLKVRVYETCFENIHLKIG